MIEGSEFMTLLYILVMMSLIQTRNRCSLGHDWWWASRHHVSVAVWIKCLHLQKWLFQYHLHVNVFYFETSESQIMPCRLLFAIKLLMFLIKLPINFCWLFRVMAPQIKNFTRKPTYLKLTWRLIWSMWNFIYFTPISCLLCPLKSSQKAHAKPVHWFLAYFHSKISTSRLWPDFTLLDCLLL